jgi:ethanolamine ammonia-lyase large subunit
LRRLFSLANAFKEGDLAVGGTADDALREAARGELRAITIGQIRRASFVDDDISEALDRSRDRRVDDDLDPLTIDRMRGLLLAPAAPAWVRAHGAALTSEAIAAVVKVMTNAELSQVARTLFNPLGTDAVAIGAMGHFGSRIQPNSPGDDEDEILFSILEGLSHGCGDVIVGLNPASDDLDTIVRLEQLLERVVRRLDLPTRYCVLSDIVKQHAAHAHTVVDVGFQSLAGTSRALAGMVGLDVDGLVDVARHFEGLYFETGQGSAITNGTAEGVDMVTLEARAYGLARHLQRQIGAAKGPNGPWMIVNDVAGFIGPEVFKTAEQLERACLEDIVMAKLHGVTMGLDVCATFHMGIAPSELRRLTARIVDRAAPAYLMAVAGNADPMLGYLTTSFREHPPLRRLLRRRVTTRMFRQLTDLGIFDSEGVSTPGSESVARLWAIYQKAGGEHRTVVTLEEEGRRKVNELRERGFDLGGMEEAQADARVDTIYANARSALYATIDESVIRDVTQRSIRVRTMATDRDDYLAHPPQGERLCDEDARTVRELYASRQPHVQIVISDGLNANAINEQLRSLLPPLRRLLVDGGHHLGDTDILVKHGRVRVGYEIGGLVGATVIVHIVGERPGTGLNTASAYITYGRDERGQSRWSRELPHSATTAICGIHRRGKTPENAALDIASTVARAVTQRRSGVALQP